MVPGFSGCQPFFMTSLKPDILSIGRKDEIGGGGRGLQDCVCAVWTLEALRYGWMAEVENDDEVCRRISDLVLKRKDNANKGAKERKPRRHFRAEKRLA